jgi:hypothetical protein
MSLPDKSTALLLVEFIDSRTQSQDVCWSVQIAQLQLEKSEHLAVIELLVRKYLIQGFAGTRMPVLRLERRPEHLRKTRVVPFRHAIISEGIQIR